MMSRPSVGHWEGILTAASFAALACGGHSKRSQGDDEAAGQASGSRGGTGGASVGGAVGVGGTTPSGGGSGTSLTGGADGGGTPECFPCVEWEYGVTILNDGPSFTMSYNGTIPAAQPLPNLVACSETPVRGQISGCGRNFAVSVCEGPMNALPCLEIVGRNVRYLDRQTRQIWTGILTSDVSSPSIPGVSSGTLTADVSAAGPFVLTLEITYSFCSQLVALRIPC
jgi:hypothetical protein